MPKGLGMLKTVAGSDSLENLDGSGVIHRFESIARWHKMF
jgi:hypothetical protein